MNQVLNTNLKKSTGAKNQVGNAHLKGNGQRGPARKRGSNTTAFGKVDSVRRLLAHDGNALTAYDGALIGKSGGNHGNQYTNGKVDNVKLAKHEEGGNSKSYSLRRLKRERPDLFTAVVNKEKSANAAAIEAGWRKRMIQVEPSKEGFVKAIRKHLPGYELRKCE